VDALVFYLALVVLGLPLWWPALRTVLGEVLHAAETQPPEAPTARLAAPLSASPGARWSTPRTRLSARHAARQISSPRRWEGGFGRRSP